MNVRLHHVQVGCPSGGEGEARRFWVDGLAMTEVAKPEPLAGRGGAWFRAYGGPAADGRVVAEVHVGVEDPCTPPRRAHPALLLDDDVALAAAGDRLRRLGFEVDDREWQTFPGYHRLHARDAHGNRVELLAPDPADPADPA